MNPNADLLRRAATILRERAEAASPGPWRHHDTHLDAGGHTATVLSGDNPKTGMTVWLPTWSHEPWDEAKNAWNNAVYISQLHPPVALALANLLDLHARGVDARVFAERHVGIPEGTNIDDEERAAIACARAVLREPEGEDR